MNLLMKGAALAPPFSCTTKYSSDVYSPRPPDIRVRLLPTKPPVHFTTEQPGRDKTDRAAVPYRMLIWYAQYFDVSMDYIFGLCDDKRGRIVTVSPEGAEEYVRRKPDWSEFVEACFEPGSELNRKLKQMVLNMAEEHSHGVKEG